MKTEWTVRVGPDARDLLQHLLDYEIADICDWVKGGMLGQNSKDDDDLEDLAADARYLGRCGRMLLQLEADR